MCHSLNDIVSMQLEEPMRIGQHIYPAGQRIAGSAKYCLGTKVNPLLLAV